MGGTTSICVIRFCPLLSKLKRKKKTLVLEDLIETWIGSLSHTGPQLETTSPCLNGFLQRLKKAFVPADDKHNHQRIDILWSV